jgi:hypothetical protein
MHSCLVKNNASYTHLTKKKFIVTPSDFSSVEANNMGKGVAWSAKEREAAALAWFRATNDATVGADQKIDEFQNKIFSLFKMHAPPDHRQGTYGDRTPTGVYNYLTKDIFPDIQSFNNDLSIVHNSNPMGGVNFDNKISMAIAMHTIKEVTRMDYRFKDHDHTKWSNYLAWKVLRHAPKFRPPSPPLMTPNYCPPSVTANNIDSTFPDSATANTTIMEMTTNQYSSSTPAVAVASLSNSSFSNVASSDDLNKKRAAPPVAFLPSDPSLGGRGAEMGKKKAKKEYDKLQSEELKEKRFNKLHGELHEQTTTQKRLARLYELRSVIKAATISKNKKLLKEANNEMAKFLNSSSSVLDNPLPTIPTMPTDEDNTDDSDESMIQFHEF